MVVTVTTLDVGVGTAACVGVVGGTPAAAGGGGGGGGGFGTVGEGVFVAVGAPFPFTTFTTPFIPLTQCPPTEQK